MLVPVLYARIKRSLCVSKSVCLSVSRSVGLYFSVAHIHTSAHTNTLKKDIPLASVATSYFCLNLNLILDWNHHKQEVSRLAKSREELKIQTETLEA